MKQIVAFGFLSSIIQTVFYSFLLALVYLTVTPNQKLVIGTIFPFIVLAFFIIVLIQNVLTSIFNSKKFTWIFFVLSIGLFSLPIFNPLRILLSVLFCLLIVLIFLIPRFLKKNLRTIEMENGKL